MADLASGSPQIASTSGRPAAPLPARSAPARAASPCPARPRSSPAVGGAPRRQARDLSARAAAVATGVQEEAATELPEGYVRYETMLILRPDLSEDARKGAMKKVEDFLGEHDTIEIKRLVKGSQQLAYPILRFWEGVYVLYTYAAQPQTVVKLQKLLSTPVVGETQNWLRYMTFVRAD